MFRASLSTTKVTLFLLLATAMVTLSGCGKVKVPDLSGMTRAQAESALTGAKLSVGTVSEEYHPTVAADRVLRQTPEAGVKVKTKSAVAFVVSKGPEPPAQAAVPYVVGMARAAAEAALTGAGLAVGTVTEVYDATAPAGQVLAQDPVAGTMAAPGSAVTLTVSKGPEPPVQVAVPDVAGMTQAAAEAALTGAGLTVGTVTEAFSDTVPAGQVISQNPAAATLAVPGFAVNLTVSKGPEPVQVAVPDVVGMAQAAAEAALTGAGLTVGTVTEVFSATVPAGQVISQNPAAAALVAPGTAVNLTVSKGPEPVQVPVPNVVGMARGEAETVLAWAGLVVGTVTEAYSASAPAGQVISQNPAAAALVATGSAVDLVVSKGPEPVAVPSLAGMTQAQAATALMGAGLTLGTVIESFSDTVPAGQVMGQTPAAGAMVAPGSAVNLELSKGPAPAGDKEVPNVVGMTQAAAATALTTAELTLGTVTEAYSATVPAGQVISQNPVAGAMVAAGVPVNLVVSKGPEPVAVPDVVGLTQAGAATALLNAGFVVGTVTEVYSATVPSGRVISQTPAAAAMAAPGSAVDLVVSKGPEPVAVPNVAGMTQAAATTAITGAGLVVGTVTEAYSATVPAGQVISQSPAAAAMVLPGSPVALVVSKGPEPVAVPNVAGLTQAAATTAITGAGLVVGTVTDAYSNTVPAGQVISQNPAAAAMVLPGSAVSLVISLGPEPVAVPNVAGLTQAAATTAITGAGLVVGAVTEAFSETVPLGQVISQNPAAAVIVDSGSAVDLVVSKGPAPAGDKEVPDVAGMTQAAAETALLAAELALGAVTEAYSETVPAGQVISQNPVAGTMVAAGTPVNLVVSKGSEPVSVPDAGLAAAIRDQLALAPATPLTRAHLAALTTLEAYTRGITDLTGLEHAPSLTILNLGDNNVADLTPLSGLTGLGYLYLYSNQVSDLGPLSGLTGLKTLSLETNQIADLTPLSGLAGLEQLYLETNQIADLAPLSGLTALKRLGLGANQITDLAPLSGLTALTRLSLGTNQIADLTPLSGLASLTRLTLSSNQITTAAGLEGLTGLQVLDLGSNALTDAGALATLSGLTSLSLGNNQLTGLPDLSALTVLVLLEVQNNQLTDTDAFAVLPSLDSLYLSQNQIADVTGLSALSALTTLELAYNQITGVTPLGGLSALQWLNLRGNRITDAAPLAGLASLYSLNLRNNNLVTVAALVGGAVFTTASSAPSLYLQGNPLLAEVCDTQIPALETRGVTVYHDVCTGPVYVPDLSGMTRAAAQAALEALGLYVDTVTEVFSETVPAGFLTDQDPPAGFPVATGSGVRITVSAGPEGGQPVLVPDANLAAAIRAALGLAPGTPLTTAHLAALNSLGANGAAIADLTGLEYAVNLVYLGLSNNDVSSAAPLAGLASLRSLTLSMNPVTDLTPLAGLTSLTTLYLYFCGAADITPLAGLVNLYELNLNSNGLTDLGALSGMTGLTHLYVNDNALTSLAPLSGLPALIHLEAHHNLLADVSGISGLAGLSHLNLANNRIQDASPLAGLTHLGELNLRYNLLTTMAAFPGGAVFTEAGGTPYLYLEQNPLLPEVCDTQIPALETLGVVVYHDPCTGPVLVPDVTGVPQSQAEITLEDAGLDTGNVAEVFSETVPAGFVISQDPAAGTPVTPDYDVDLVVSLGTEAGQLVNVPDPNLAAAIRQELGLDPATDLTTAHLASLYSLTAVFESIADLTGLEYAVNLRWLNIGANPIADVSPLAGAVSLQSLGLYECALTDITPLAGLANLESVNLRDNAITDVGPLAGMTRVIALYLNDNELTDISPLSGLTGLLSLYLGGNHVQDVSPLANLAALNELSLGGNHITSVAALASGTVFSLATSPTPYVEIYSNPLLPAACDTEIPALEARGVTVYHDACTGIVYVPDVTGVALAAAGFAITDAGLYVGDVTQSFSETVPAGFVISQYPAAGVPAIPSSGVDLVVSKGPEVAVLVNVPDPNLAAAIRTQLEFDPATALTTAHLAALTYLNAGWIGVADLTGLEYGVNLTTLYLGGNVLTDVSPLAGLTSLQFLALDSNALTDITPLAGLVRLNNLYLGSNHIADAEPLAGLTALTYLDLYYNVVGDATPFAGLVNLVQLGLQRNQVVDASPLAGLDILRNLVLSNNFITTLAPLVSGTVFTNATNQECYLNGNPLLPEVCATQIPALEARGVAVYHEECNGGVAVPDVVGMPRAVAGWELEQAGLYLGDIIPAFSETVPAGFVISQAVPAGTVVLAGSPVAVTVSEGPEGGQPVNVPDPVLAAAIRVEAGLDPGTPLTTAHLASITWLYASYSGVTDLTGLEYAVNLGYLYAAGNAILSAAPLAGLEALWEVYLYDNLLTDTAPFANLSQLSTLDIGNNHVTSVAPLAAGAVFTDAPMAPALYVVNNPLLSAACDTDIPALEARGVTVHHDAPCPGAVFAPDLVGRSQAAAQGLMDAAGLYMSVSRTFSETVPAGYVMSQSPAAGVPTIPGSAVEVAVSDGPEAGVLVNVPDAVLAAAIRNALGLDPATPLTTAHLAQLGYLSTGWSGVTDLTGLEYAVNLTSLYLDGESPADLGPISGLVDLWDFSCYECGITDVTPLAGLVSLRTLYLSRNAVSDPTPLAALTELEILDLTRNGLTDVAWAPSHTGLLDLYLSDNLLTDVSPLAAMTQLRSLTLSNNLLTDATPLANLSELQMLGLAYNHLTTLASLVAGTIFTEAAVPGDVYLGGNPFPAEVCDTQIPALEARGVTIYHDICPGTAYVPDLVGLTEAGSRQELTAAGLLWYTPTGVFSEVVPAGFVISQDPPAGLPVLPSSYVDLTVSLGPEAGQLVSVPDANLAAGIRTELALAPATPLTTAHLAELYSLNVSATGLADLTGLEYAVNLVYLYAVSNNIASAAPLGGLVNLIGVQLNNNLVTDASPFAGMAVLRDLGLDNNLLTDASPLADLARMQTLGLSYNQLTTLAPLVSGTVFTNAPGPAVLWVLGNAFLPEVCTVQIPALEAAGVSVQHTCP